MVLKKKPTYVLGSTEWWKHQKHNLGHTILKLALYILIFFAIWELISPLINFGGIYSWWREQKETADSISRANCFSFANLAYYEHFPIYAWLASWVMPTTKSIKSQAQADVLLFLIKNFANGVIPGGSLTGKALCQSIIPDWPPPSSLRTQYATCFKKDNVAWKDTSQWPTPEDSQSWRQIVYLWGGLGKCGPDSQDACDADAAQPSGAPCSMNPDPTTSCGSAYTWIASGMRQGSGTISPTGLNAWMGNFLWQAYQIPFNSPLVVGFVSQSLNICDTDVTTSTEVLKILLGYKETINSPQGWWGAIQYISNRTERSAFIDLHTFFWEGVEMEKAGGIDTGNKNPNGNCGSGGIATGVTTGIGAAGGVGMAGAMMTTACTGLTIASWGWAAAPCAALVVTTVGVGAVAGMNAAGKAGCCSGIGQPPCCTTKKGCPKSGSSGCIAMSQIVEIKNNGNCFIENIKPGDYIKNINGDWDLIYAISEHKEVHKILNIYFENIIIKLTPEHLIYKNNRLVKSETVKSGDDIDGHVIQKIEITFEKVRNPVTISGSILLGNIPISCHNHSEKHAKKMQDLADCFDFRKLSDHIGSELVNEIANEMYKKLKNKKLKNYTRIPIPPYSPISPG